MSNLLMVAAAQQPVPLQLRQAAATGKPDADNATGTDSDKGSETQKTEEELVISQQKS
jgi:hypothetical protein